MKKLTLELPATPEGVMRGVDHLEEFCRAADLPQKAIHELMLVVEEMASNVVNHAYRRAPGQSFRLTLEHRGDRFTVELRDHGPAYDPLQAPAPTLDEDREIGGLGIHLVRHYMEELQYTREGDENVVRLTKHLPPA